MMIPKHRPLPAVIHGALLLTLCCLPAVHAQSPDAQTRSAWDEEFLRSRAKARAAAPSTQAAPAAQSYIGVTLWRMRQARADDPADSRAMVLLEGQKSEFTPERVSLATPLGENELVRVVVESTRPGYLYVVDRERYADGTSGRPTLIFPDLRIRKGANRVEPGQVVEIPDSTAFRLVRSRPDQVSEALTILLTPAPLEGKMGPQQVDAGELEQWEKQWGASSRHEFLESAGLSGRRATGSEVRAMEGHQMLGPSDPVPHSLFRITAGPGKPILAAVQVRFSAR